MAATEVLRTLCEKRRKKHYQTKQWCSFSCKRIHGFLHFPLLQLLAYQYSAKLKVEKVHNKDNWGVQLLLKNQCEIR